MVTADGVEHEVDVLICATGFKLWERDSVPPFPVIGRDGLDAAGVLGGQPLPGLSGRVRTRVPEHVHDHGPYGFALGSYLWMIESRHI